MSDHSAQESPREALDRVAAFLGEIERAGGIAVADSAQRISPHWLVSEAKALRDAIAILASKVSS